MLEHIKKQLGNYYKSGGKNILEWHNYRIECSYKTVLVFENGINVFTMYPWQGITTADVKAIIADYLPNTTETELDTMSSVIANESALIAMISEK